MLHSKVNWFLLVWMCVALGQRLVLAAEPVPKSSRKAVTVWVFKNRQLAPDGPKDVQMALPDYQVAPGPEKLAYRVASCKEFECFERLDENGHNLMLILHRTTEHSRGRSDDQVDLLAFIYDKNRNSAPPEGWQCISSTLPDCEKRFLRTIFGPYSKAPFNLEKRGPSIPDRTESRPFPQNERPLSFWRGSVAGALVSLFAIGLGSGITLSIYHHKPAGEDPSCDDARSSTLRPQERSQACVWDAALPLAISYATAGLAAAGVGIVLGVR